MTTPTQPTAPDPQGVIVLRLPRAKKGRYVQAARIKGQKLAQWCVEKLDQKYEQEKK